MKGSKNVKWDYPIDLENDCKVWFSEDGDWTLRQYGRGSEIEVFQFGTYLVSWPTVAIAKAEVNRLEKREVAR